MYVYVLNNDLYSISQAQKKAIIGSFKILYVTLSLGKITLWLQKMG